MARIDRHAHIKAVLEVWGIWRVSGLSGLTYPSSTVEARLREYGAALSGTPGPRVIRYMPHIVCSNIDRIVCEWPNGGPESARRYNVLWCQYVGNEGKGMDMEQKLSATGLGKSRFYEILGEIHEKLNYLTEIRERA